MDLQLKGGTTRCGLVPAVPGGIPAETNLRERGRFSIEFSRRAAERVPARINQRADCSSMPCAATQGTRPRNWTVCLDRDLPARDLVGAAAGEVEGLRGLERLGV